MTDDSNSLNPLSDSNAYGYLFHILPLTKKEKDGWPQYLTFSAVSKNGKDPLKMGSHKQGVVAHSLNPSIWETEAGGPL